MMRRRRIRSRIDVTACATLKTGLSAAVATPASVSGSSTVTSLPDLVSALTTAAAQSSRVEVTDLEDAYSTTCANLDGGEATDTSQNPVRVRKAGYETTSGHCALAAGDARSPAWIPRKDGTETAVGIMQSYCGHLLSQYLGLRFDAGMLPRSRYLLFTAEAPLLKILGASLSTA